MSDFPAHLCGAIIDPVETEAACIALSSQGKEPLFCDAAPQLAGFGEGKSVFAGDAEIILFGKQLPPWHQTRGTCVSMGTGRAIQDSLYYGLAYGTVVGKPVSLCSETIYGGARMTVGRGEMGKACRWGAACGGRGQPDCGDGAYPPRAALFVHDFGLLARGVYGTIDLREFREDLSILWGNNGVPSALLAESASYKAAGCFKATTVEQVRDGIAAGYTAARAAAKATHGIRDKNGMLEPVDSGGHDQELCSVFVDVYGDLCFEEQQSWGEGGPQGGGPYKCQDGREVTPRPGACGIHAETVHGYLRTGEIWLFAPPRTPWAPEAA